MNSSALVALLVPPAAVTVTSTVPAALGGETAVIVPAETTSKLLAGVLPKSTAVAPDRFVPLITTDVPPLVGPAVGSRPDTAGAGEVGKVGKVGKVGVVMAAE